jgi:hypothetical protein
MQEVKRVSYNEIKYTCMLDNTELEKDAEIKLKELEEYLRSNPHHINEEDDVRILLLLLLLLEVLSLSLSQILIH